MEYHKVLLLAQYFSTFFYVNSSSSIAGDNPLYCASDAPDAVEANLKTMSMTVLK